MLRFQKFQNLEKKKKIGLIVLLALLVLLLLLAVAGGIWFFLHRDGRRSGQRQGGFDLSGMVTEDMIAASGVTSVGMTEEAFDVENLSVGIEIEEVYVSSGEEIAEGTKVLKLSEEDLAEAREELEKALREADLAYRAGAIEYEQNLITAVYERDSAILAGEQAQEVYDETVAGLDSAVEKAQEELDDAKEQIAEYQSYVTNDTYRDYFKVDEYQTIYDENLKLLTDRMEEYSIHWPEVTGGSSGAGGGGSAEEGDNSSAERKQEVQMLSSLYKILEQNLEDLEKAQEEYEDALLNASFELQTLELKLPGLEQAVTEAKENYASRLLQAKLTYETSLADAESAESDYETAIQKAASDYEELKDDYEDAKENLELFEELAGDGYFYASGNGTILRTMLRAGQDLTAEAVVFVYSNPEEMTVTVSVDQADIAKIALGDEAVVMTSEYGNFEGTVTEINPVTYSTSRTSVSYSVTVTLSGDTAEVPANTSVTVILGMSIDQIPTGQSGAEEGGPGGGQISGGDAWTEGGRSEDGQALGEGGRSEDGQTPGEGGRSEDGQAPGEGGRSEGGQTPGEGGGTEGGRTQGEGGRSDGGQAPGEGGPSEREQQDEVKQND